MAHTLTSLFVTFAILDSGISIEILSVSLELFIVDDVVEKISADTLVSNDA